MGAFIKFNRDTGLRFEFKQSVLGVYTHTDTYVAYRI